ncbi:hypothetical protein HN51_016596 [Arachis hypogaea]
MMERNVEEGADPVRSGTDDAQIADSNQGTSTGVENNGVDGVEDGRRWLRSWSEEKEEEEEGIDSGDKGK